MRALLLASCALLPNMIASGQTDATLTITGHSGWVGSVAFSPDGKTLATGSADKTARLWDVATGRELGRLSGHSDYVASVAFTSQDSLATASYDHTARLWNLATRQSTAELKGHRGAVVSVAISPGGKILASGSLDRTIRLWNPNSGERIAVLEGHKSWVNALTFNPDGDLLVSGSSDGTMKLWDMPKGDLHSTIDVTKAEIRSLAFARDGSALAAGLRYGDLKVWLAADWSSQQAKVSPGDVWAVAYSSDGKRLFSSDGDWNQPSRVRVSDAKTLKPLGYLQHTGEVLSIAVSPDGKSVAAGSWDKTVRIWNVEKAMKAAE